MLRRDGADAEAAREPLVLPIHADAALPDYVVPQASYNRGLSTRWQPGDRFRMQFGGRKGSWYRGTVVSVRGLTGGPSADPWEALEVKWEDGGSSAMPRVSPWEVELDPNSIEVRVDRRTCHFVYLVGLCTRSGGLGGCMLSGVRAVIHRTHAAAGHVGAVPGRVGSLL